MPPINNRRRNQGAVRRPHASSLARESELDEPVLLEQSPPCGFVRRWRSAQLEEECTSELGVDCARRRGRGCALSSKQNLAGKG